MQITDRYLYWMGDAPVSAMDLQHINRIESLSQLPQQLGGAVCFSFNDAEQQDRALRTFYTRRFSWSWCVFVTQESDYSPFLSDGLYHPEQSQAMVEQVAQRLVTLPLPDTIEPMVGWLGLHRDRRVLCRKDVNYAAIYSYPIIESLYPELESSYRFTVAELKRHVLEAEQLVDRIRVCSSCSSGHLNFVDVCPSCSSIDIDLQSSLHCFTCGHVDDQQSFLRRGRLECPKCLTQLRHIGVDYDRPLESYVCSSCSNLFAEAETIAQCISCDRKHPVDELVMRKIHRFKLGEAGQFQLQHGKHSHAPEISIKGKVDGRFFLNLLSWVNKVALRHDQPHLLMALYFPAMNDFAVQHGDSKLFALIEQITARLSSLFRDTDVCCQYKQDLLLVLMPKTDRRGLASIEQKLNELSQLIDVEDFYLDVHVKGLPEQGLGSEAELWLENWMRDIYVGR